MEQPRLIRKLQVGLIDLTLTRRCKRAVNITQQADPRTHGGYNRLGKQKNMAQIQPLTHKVDP